ncbi:MAG: hypothetical protein LBC85_00250 [Fibromonadaceae bacterium]|jgi:hypothetical protein|nr:hypothetical protein [Fibromonadaceae bacterium]
MKIDVQKFMELRESARAKEGLSAKRQTEKADWRALLDSKRKEIGLEPAAPKAAKVSDVKTDKHIKAVAMDFNGTIEERVGALRERSAEGLPVRELGNFIDVRA